ncbi:MAG: ABC-F family ATP-binding cassette domain-containing protein [Bdellovibrio sp.]|nr:ABC-F family ATP-binding cassette domain-containing protein [Bdellovibrio sp.]
MSNLLRVTNLRAKNPAGEWISPQISFDLQAGEVLFFRGENGAGKSTLLKTILGLHKKFTGEFQFALRPEEIQYLPQLGNLHFHLPLTLQDMLKNTGTGSPLLQGLDLQKKWNTASGGERQKILLASVLEKNPRLLILDEPFNHVDKESVEVIEDALGTFLKSHPQSSMILVSHRAFVQDWAHVRFLEIR